MLRKDKSGCCSRCISDLRFRGAAEVKKPRRRSTLAAECSNIYKWRTERRGRGRGTYRKSPWRPLIRVISIAIEYLYLGELNFASRFIS